MTNDLSWDAAVARYIQSRDISGEYARDLRTMCGRFGAFANNGTPLMVPGISDTAVNDWLESLKRDGLSRKRIYHHRAAVLAVWREEVMRGNVEDAPRFVRKIRPERKPVLCWTLDELRRFVVACDVVPGMMRHQSVSRSHWWKSFGHLGYDTALRRQDVLSLPWNWLHEESKTVQRFQSKTGNVVVHWLHAATLDLIDKLDRSTPYILTWPYHHSKFDYWMRKIVAAAGIRKGTSRWIRRSSASYVELENPGHASRHLGHASPGMVRYYLDPSITNARPVRPPEL